MCLFVWVLVWSLRENPKDGGTGQDRAIQDRTGQDRTEWNGLDGQTGWTDGTGLMEGLDGGTLVRFLAEQGSQRGS